MCACMCAYEGTRDHNKQFFPLPDVFGAPFCRTKISIILDPADGDFSRLIIRTIRAILLTTLFS